MTIWRPSQGHPGDGSGNANTNGWTSSGSGGAMPIIVDLAGMGIKIEELSRSNIFIDSEGSGLKHRTAWVGVVDHTQSITTGMDSNGVRTQMR